MTLETQLLVLGPDAPLDLRAACRLLADALLVAEPAQGVPERSSAQRTSRRNTLGGPPRPAVCAIGAFDGVHSGHRALIARARTEAIARDSCLVVITFSPDPADVLLGNHCGDTLLRPDQRRGILAGLEGVDEVVTLSFTPELAAVPYDRFVREALGSLVELDAIVVGSNFRLGAGGAGDVAALSALGAEDGFDVIGMDLVDEGGEPVSATRIRGLVRAGRVERAAGLLGRCHAVSGRVVRGRGEGTTFGFPTANVRLDERLCLPDQGVYAGFLVTGATAWPAAINVGLPPTFSPGASGGPRAFLEANLIGFEGDLYGSDVTVVFARWLRDSRPFDSLEELERVVLGNVGWVRATFGERGVWLGEGASA